MMLSAKSATALALIFTLAACGGGAEEADDPVASETTAINTTAPVADEPPAAEASPTPGATPSEGASPTPAPTASASRATPTPTPVAAAGPPPMFAVCAACHSVSPGDHGIGPSLAGVFNARAGSKPGFEYSQAMIDAGLTWNQGTLDRYLEAPRDVVPGTTMAYNGLKNAAQRQAIVTYLRGL